MHLLCVLILISIFLLLLMGAKNSSNKSNVLRGGILGRRAILARVFFMRLPQPSRGRCENESVEHSQFHDPLHLLIEMAYPIHSAVHAPVLLLPGGARAGFCSIGGDGVLPKWTPGPEIPGPLTAIWIGRGQSSAMLFSRCGTLYTGSRISSGSLNVLRNGRLRDSRLFMHAYVLCG